MRWILFLSLLFTVPAQAEVSFEEFESLRQIFLSEYGPEIKAQNAQLFINNPPPNSPEDFWWNIPTVRAAYATYIDATSTRMHYITLMGGYGKLPFMTIDTIAATLCHELGHGIAGEPFKDNGEVARSSTEGQADYFAYRHCLPRILKHYSMTGTSLPVDAVTDGLCRKTYSDVTNLKYCTRAFHSLEVEKKYFKHDTGIDVSYSSADQTVAAETDLHPDFYPSPQCRLDTMMAGILSKPRPACWFKANP